MARLLVVHHSPTPTVQRLTDTVLAGTRDEEIEGVDVVVRPALEAHAEDVLSAARDGRTRVTPALIGDALTCLDQVVQWLDVTEAASEFPTDADGAADAIVRRFRREAECDGEGCSRVPRPAI